MAGAEAGDSEEDGAEGDQEGDEDEGGCEDEVEHWLTVSAEAGDEAEDAGGADGIDAEEPADGGVGLFESDAAADGDGQV